MAAADVKIEDVKKEEDGEVVSAAIILTMMQHKHHIKYDDFYNYFDRHNYDNNNNVNNDNNNQGPRHHQCDVCGLVVRTRSRLEIHQRTHTSKINNDTN